MKIHFVADSTTDRVYRYVDNGVFFDGRRKTLAKYGVDYESRKVGLITNLVRVALPPPPPRLHGRFGLPLVLIIMVDPSGTLMTSGILVFLQ